MCGRMASAGVGCACLPGTWQIHRLSHLTEKDGRLVSAKFVSGSGRLPNKNKELGGLTHSGDRLGGWGKVTK